MDSFICYYCGAKYRRKTNLQRHIQSKHESQNYGWKCSFCEKHFNRKDNYERHRRLHTDVTTLYECYLCSKKYKSKPYLIDHLSLNHNFPFRLVEECCYCMKKFRNKSYLKKHVNKFHPKDSKRQFGSQFRCGLCSYSFFRKTDIHKHYESYHNIELKVEELSFQCYADFQKWKLQMQRRTISQFYKRSIWKSSSSVVRIFQCHRSGFQTGKENSIKFPPQNGSKKLNAYCPSEIRIKIKISDGTCRVEYLSTHVGHILEDVNEWRYIHLDKSERIEIAEKFKLDISQQECVPKSEKMSVDCLTVRNCYDTCGIDKTHSVAKECNFTLENEDMEVNAFIEKNKNIILYYKKKKEPDDKFNLLSEHDFVLIIMNKWQEKHLHLYGNKVIAFDSTNNTDKYEILLHTMLVLDVDCEGVPVSFLLTNRNDRIVMNIFLSCIRDRIGVFSPKVILTDMRKLCYKSWTETMSSTPTLLYCTWHIIRAWRQNLLSKIKDSEKKEYISNTLYDLLLELNPLSFEKKLKELLECDDPNIQEFQNYFEEQYSGKYVHFWARCYCQHAGVNTNMAMASFYKSLKYPIIKGLKKGDLHGTLNCIENYSRLHEEESKIRIIEGKELYKFRLLRTNHHKARNFLAQCDISTIVTNIDGKSFFVRSFDNIKRENNLPKLYLVSKILDSQGNEFKECSAYGKDVVCRLPCDLCRICFHDYMCNCVDSSIKSNMCKHIHAVGIFLRSLKRSEDLETSDLIYCVDPEPMHDINDSLVKSDENTINQSLTVLSETQKIEDIRNKMFGIVDNLIWHTINNGGKAEHLEWIEKQYFQPSIPALHNYILMGQPKI